MKGISCFLVAVTITFALPSLAACGGPTPGAQAPEESIPEEEQYSEAVAPEEREITGNEAIIESVNAYQDLFSEWTVVGLIRNVSEFPVGNVTLQLQFFDSGDNVLYDATSVEAGSGLMAGEELPFQLLTMQQIPSMDRYEVSVTGLAPFEKEVINVTTHGVNMAVRENDLIQVVGEIENPSEQSVYIDRVVASIQDVNGELLSAGACDVCVQYLEPGERGPFRIQFYGSRAAAGYKVYVSAVPVIDLDDLQIDILEGGRTFSDSLSWFHVVGEATNNGDDRYMISLLATLFDQDRNVIDVSAAGILPAVLIPGESGYFDLKFGGPSTGALDAARVADWDVQVDRMQTGPIDEAEQLVPLVVSSEAQYPSDGLAVIDGTVVNDSGQAIRAVYVTVLLRDGRSGETMGLGEFTEASTLSPGDELPYLVNVDFDPQVIDSDVQVAVFAMGVVSK
jgi:hypothetical protein